MWSYNYAYPSNELYHHGIKGQRWGVRRFQNKDGTLTDAGKKRQKSNSHPHLKKLAKKGAIAAAGIAISYGGAKFAANPHVRSLFGKVLDKIGSKKVSDVSESLESLSGIVSKVTGKELTIAEAIEMGLW